MAPSARKTTCLACKRIAPHAGKGRCASCLEKWNQKRERTRSRTRQQPWYDHDWRVLARETVEKHVRRNGYTCTNCTRADPQTNPLQLDHVVDRSIDHGTQVLCRSCNASKGAHSGNAQRRRNPAP